MEAALHADDFKGTIAMHAPIFACQFDGAFVGLRATIGEERAHAVALLAEQFGQLDLARVVVQIGDMHQLRHLLLHRLR